MAYSRAHGPVPIRPQGVKFADSVVTSISRPTTSKEEFAIYQFEIHAQICDHCYDPYKVQKAGHRLCHKGHELAIEVAKKLYCTRDGEIFCVHGESEALERVEISLGYDNVYSLLRAIERSRRHHRHSKPFVVLESYRVASRSPQPRPHLDVKLTQPNPPEGKGKKVYPVTPVVDRRTAEEYDDTRRPVVVRVERSKRGSLYEKDMEDQKHRQQKYKIEVRAPREHRSTRYFDNERYYYP